MTVTTVTKNPARATITVVAEYSAPPAWVWHGHDVAVPDRFEGTTFATVETGVAHADEVGFDTITDRGVDAAEGLDDGLGEIIERIVGFVDNPNSASA